MDAKKDKKIVVLATGGTIAGLAISDSQPQHYQAGLLPVATLLSAIPKDFIEQHQLSIAAEQIAQIDSKDMQETVWHALATRLWYHLNQPEVDGVVITHGSDTLEETAYFLQAVFQPSKPVVLTCAMRPANAPDADGPANLRDALLVAAQPDLNGVLVVCGGSVHAGHRVQKIQNHDLKPFASQEGPLARLVLGKFQILRPVTSAEYPWPMPTAAEVLQTQDWPRVELVLNHAGAHGENVRDMLQSSRPPKGIVVAGTGNGTVHQGLEKVLKEAQSQGVRVLRTTRCALGQVQALPDDVLASVPDMTPVQARVSLQLALIKQALGCGLI
jgi:L-asparaginase